MAVKENGGFCPELQRFRIDERVEIRGHDLNRFKSGCAQIVGHQRAPRSNIRLVFALGADARDSQEFHTAPPSAGRGALQQIQQDS